MIPAIQEIGFGPGTDKAYATLHQATVSFAEMGERTISTQVRIDGDVVPDFDGWEVSFKGERFILNTKDPQAVKDNSTRNSLVDLTFVSWVVNELKRYFFFEPTSIDAGTAIADKYKASVNVPVEDFAVLFNKVLDYYFDGKVVFSLYMSGQGQYSTDRALVEIDYTYIWDVLVKFFEIYGVRWRIEHDNTNDVYTIKAGWPTTDIDINDHDFEYGYKGGLLRFERQVQDVDIHNILLGRGGEKNIPYRYFKRIDPQNPDWAADPDAIPELSNIYFDRIRDINFRWYVRGWMQNPNHDTSWEEDGYVYPTYTIASDSHYYFAYQKGLTDEKFNPVEYVKDDESIADYGEHWGALDDNDDIFPTIQGVTRDPLGRIDETVAVSEIVTDDIDAMAQNAAIEKSINRLTISLDGDTRTEFDLQSEEFTIPSGSTGNVTYVPIGTDDNYPGLVRFDTDNSTVVAVADGVEYPIDAIPAGTYRLKLHMVIARSGQATSATGTFGIENIVLTTSSMDTDAWKPTFDIWVKNIWGTTKGQDENDIQYAERVWLPILGDRAGNEAKIVFSSGFMSVSEDYEFTIVSYPVYDTSKSINGVPSEWRITLRKSDAEFDATGLYIPNASTGGQPIAGDKFFFIGIDMPFRYVELAEEDLNTNKEAQLDTEAAISPTWIMNLDKVRVHTLEDQEYGRTLADRLAAGGKVWIKDKRFTPGQRLQLYVQSITYTWNEPSDDSPYIVPDIEVVLSDKVVAVDSIVQRIQSDVSSIKNQYARISDVEAVVRSVAEPIFLKKTGESDSSDSPTQFSSKVTSKGFRQGAIGGKGWGIYRDNTSAFAADENEQSVQTRGTRSLRALRANASEQEEEADAVIEADRIVVRKELQVNSLVINQIAYVGGKEIISAAKIEVSKVIETADGYICYFDQRRNSVANNFAVNDIAFGQVFNPDNTEQRYYKMVVTATDVDCITLSKSPKDGSGAPKVGDIIVQYGNTTNTDRQYVIVRDVIGGGYERMLSGLSSVSSTGKEYYFAGRQNNSGARWFVGDSLGDYAEYEDGVLTIKANVIFKAGQEIPGLSDLETQVDNLEYLHTALPKSDTIISGGLILSKVIALRDSNNAIKSGINGDPTLSSIAAWYGGPMADKEATPTPASYAQSLFRFDGSGYLAGGNIGWENDGDGHIPGISWETTGGVTSVTIGANVKLEQTGGTDSSVTDLVTAVQSFPSTYLSKTDAAELYHPLGGSTTLVSFKIGGATLTWHPQVGSTPGYIELDSAFVTNGDQIVIDGDPQGGGGGGGATMLRQLEDVYHNSTSVLRKNGGSVANGDLLSFDSTGNRWVALDQSTITPDLSNYYTKTQTDTEISSAITTLNLGAAATYGVGSVASGNTGLVTGGDVWTAIDNLPEPMVFKGSLGTGGTISSLPVNGTAQVGDTYKVITAGTYAGQAAKVGDTFICQTKTASANTWVLIPSGDEPEGTVTSVGLTLPTGLTLNTTSGSASPITDSGTFKIEFSNGYAIPTTADVEKGVTARDYFNTNGVLTYNHGGTGRSSQWTANSVIYASSASVLGQVTNVSGNNQKKFLVQTTNGSGTVAAPSWGAIASTDLPSMYIGSTPVQFNTDAEALTGITSITASGLIKTTNYVQATRFYLTNDIYFYTETINSQVCVRLNAPFITSGDQIVIDGTPGGGGGGGGATNLKELEDVYHNASGVRRYSSGNATSTDLLGYDSTKGWYAVKLGTGLQMTNGELSATGTLSSVSLAAGATNGTLHLVVNGTAQSDVAVTGLGSMAYKSSLAASDIPDLSATYQPKDADLTAIAGLTGTSGFLKKTAANTWSLDTNTYLTGITSTMVTNALGYTPANVTALGDYVKLTSAGQQLISVTGTTDTPIVFKSGLENASWIGFRDSANTILGYIGMTSADGPAVYVGGAKKIWHAGNFTPSDYLPKTGGTLKNDTSTYPLTLDTDSTTEIGMRLYMGGTQKAWVGYNPTQGVYLWDGASNKYLGIKDDGTPHYNGNTLWHAGNLTLASLAGNTAKGSTSLPIYYTGSALAPITDLDLLSQSTGNVKANRVYLTSSIYFYTETVGGTVCVRLNAPFITAGDQIVISGTPGGGGGGGATSLWGLDDVSVPHGSSTPSNGQVLTWDTSLAKWTNKSITSGVSSVVGLTGDVTAAQISSAIGLSGYLPLTGGTIKNGNAGTPLTLDTTSGTIGIYFATSATNKVWVGYQPTYGSVIYSQASSKYLGIKDDGTPHYHGNTLLHAGNYTAYVNTTNFPGLMGNQTITLSGDVSGSGATSITTTIGEGKVTNAMLAGSIANSKLSNSSITINGSSTSLGGSFSTASITAGTAGQSGASTGVSFSIPYVTMNKYGIVTAYGTHTHTISASDLTTTIGSTTYAAYHSAGYVKKDGDTMSGNLTLVGMTISGTITSTVATGTAPLSVTSTTVVSNLNADLLDGQHGSYYATASSVTTLQGYFTHGSAKAARSLASLGADSGYWYDTEYPIIAQWDDATHVRLKCTNAAGTASYDVRVNAANKFVTARTLWGQSFDGTANVTGALSSVTNIDSLLYFDTTNYRIGVGVSAPTEALHVAGKIKSVTNGYGILIGAGGNSIEGINGQSYGPLYLQYYNSGNLSICYGGGNVAIGAITPSYRLHVAGDICTNTYLRINAWSGYGSGSAAFWYNGNTSTLALDKGLSVTGTFVSTGDQVISSDLTLKENLTPVTYSVSDIAKARAVEFDWKDGRGHSMGSIAQDWLGIAPALVHGEEGSMSLAYGQLALVNTILEAKAIENLQVHDSEQDKEIRELRERVARLEMENERLRS